MTPHEECLITDTLATSLRFRRCPSGSQRVAQVGLCPVYTFSFCALRELSGFRCKMSRTLVSVDRKDKCMILYHQSPTRTYK